MNAGASSDRDQPPPPVAWCTPLPGSVAHGHEALLVREDPGAFALVGKWAGARALVGSCPVRRAPDSADAFATLADAGPVPSDAPPGFVGGGWFGYLGYALSDGPARRPRRLPAFVLGLYDHLLRLDADGQWFFEALWTPARDAALCRRRDELAARLAADRRPDPVSTAPWSMTPSPDGHARAVAAARRRIVAGDLYQANVALRLSSTLTGTPVDLFARAAAALTPDRAAFLQGDWGAVASLSPESFLARRGDRVLSRPIKGTRRRHRDAARARAARDELLASVKDRAENVMIVDLVRNDLGRVARTGSVTVGQLARAEAHPGVWHLVSQVSARMRPGADDADLLRATFPPGSVTGAPKIAAIGVIDELESAVREVFTGALGFHSPVAGLELSVVIRTFEICADQIWLDVGGGIVADSDPEAEASEAHDKARPLLAAIDAQLAPAGGPSRAPIPRRLSPRPAPRPDAAGGLLETIGVLEGRPVALERHLARLRGSMRALYGVDLPAGLREAALAAAPGAGRLRLLADPAGSVQVQAGPPVAPAEAGLTESLAPVTVPGGLGAHKWRDRRWLDALSDAVAPAQPLLVDLDGLVLEAASAAVLIVDRRGVVMAPPLDGRILPSVTRALALARARHEGLETVIAPIALDELAGAREVILASALRGIRGVTVGGPGAADGPGAPGGPGPVAAALRRSPSRSGA